MPKDKERIALSADPIGRVNLNVIRLERGYKGTATFNVVGSGLFTDPRRDEQKPRLDLDGPDGTQYYWVVNKTNEAILRAGGMEFLDELEGKTITLESYETGSAGSFAFGIRVIEVK